MKINRLFTLFIILFFIDFTRAQILIETIPDKKLKIEIQDNKEFYNIKLRILDSISTNKKYLNELHSLNESSYIESTKGHNRAESKIIIEKIDELNKNNYFFSFYELSINK